MCVTSLESQNVGAGKNLRGHYVQFFSDEETGSEQIVSHLTLELEVKPGWNPDFFSP